MGLVTMDAGIIELMGAINYIADNDGIELDEEQLQGFIRQIGSSAETPGVVPMKEFGMKFLDMLAEAYPWSSEAIVDLHDIFTCHDTRADYAALNESWRVQVALYRQRGHNGKERKC